MIHAMLEVIAWAFWSIVGLCGLTGLGWVVLWARSLFMPATVPLSVPSKRWWLDLGHGGRDLVIAQLPPGTWALIRDDSSGLPSWFATSLAQAVAEAHHKALGGTVSASSVVKR
jgi:hypothetical protein